jgi:hypothetical protein
MKFGLNIKSIIPLLVASAIRLAGVIIPKLELLINQSKIGENYDRNNEKTF